MDENKTTPEIIKNKEDLVSSSEAALLQALSVIKTNQWEIGYHYALKNEKFFVECKKLSEKYPNYYEFGCAVKKLMNEML